MPLSVFFRCVACRHHAEFTRPSSGVAMCPRCFSLMVAVSASVTRKPAEQQQREASADADQHRLHMEMK